MGGEPARTLQGTEMADAEEDSGQDSAVPGSMLPQGQKCTRPRPHPRRRQSRGQAQGPAKGNQGSERAGGSPRAQHGRLSMYLQLPSCP